ncbi:mutator type transposase [Tanacetum coccineum]
MNPQIPIKAIQEHMQKKFQVSVSKHKAFRAKEKAHVFLREDVKVQYSLLRDYANELHRCNLDTTVKIDVYVEEDPEKTTRMFRRIYVCLGALKRGFKEVGKELLGLDGAFIRGQYPGQMLTVVGMDANNGICPVAYDRQKGLLPTIAKLFPSAEHRFCVRHINENMNLTWKGGDYKEMLWRYATSTTIVKFEKHMDELKNYNKKDHEWLSKIPPQHWSRAYFLGRAHCDNLINNLCEVFNRQLLEAKDSPIITALEYVREYLMKRIVIVQKVIQKSKGPLIPAITKLFNKIKEAASKCIVDWNGSDLFQVKGPYQDQCVVNLTQKTCSCRKWEISGIPCKHVIAAIHDMADNVNGRDMWSKFECPTTLLPPKVHPQIGRPSKKRKKSKGEIAIVKGDKLTRKAGPSEPVARRRFTKKTMARKYVTRKRSACEVIQAAQGSQAATQGSQAARPCSQAAPTSPTLKRTKMSACRLTPDKQ